jgi:predicted NBD/HSP70 family sugar kinase
VAKAIEIAKHDPQGQLAQCLNASEKPTIEEVFTAARAGDMITQNLLNERARYMGISLANLVNILGPELILMGGIFSQGHDLLLPTVESTMRQRSFGRLGEQVKIRPTIFGSQSGTIGAAALALTALFYHPPEILQLNPLAEVAL